MEQRQHLALLDFFKLSLELGSGKFSRVTKCITVVLFTGRLSAFNVTLPCKNRPWYINFSSEELLTRSSSQSAGQFSKTYWHTSEADEVGRKWNSCVLPLTKINFKWTLSSVEWSCFCMTLEQKRVQSDEGSSYEERVRHARVKSTAVPEAAAKKRVYCVLW
jgi:hypothetical protein